MESIFAVGDIHGCAGKLRKMMAKIPINFRRDTLVFLGDYIDRGEDSYGVVEFLIRLRKKHPDALVFLKGNHEEMLELYLSGSERNLFLVNGGARTLESYLRRRRPDDDGGLIPPDHTAFFSALRLMYESERYIFVHAGLNPHLSVSEQRAEDLLWTRRLFINSDRDFGKRVIFGHTPFLEPLVQPNKIGIDTGAVYGRYLTCVQLPQERFFFV